MGSLFGVGVGRLVLRYRLELFRRLRFGVITSGRLRLKVIEVLSVSVTSGNLSYWLLHSPAHSSAHLGLLFVLNL